MTTTQLSPTAQEPLSRIIDTHGRQVSYLRLSTTDRCNLRCAYCFSKSIRFIPHEAILRYEEILTIVDLACELGIHKVRLTGGEPFVRKDFLWLVEHILARHPELDLRITTNATLLAGKVRTLKELGVRHLNVSLDTLNPSRFKDITGRDFFHQVRSALDEIMGQGMGLKVNAVAMRGVNDDELPAFLKLARDNPLDLRFIEFMPMGDDELWSSLRYWPAQDILRQARELTGLTPVEPSPTGRNERGPARMFKIEGGKGRLGLISPLSAHFCGTCNRLRVTPDGRLRTCLFSDREYRLLPMLRHPRLGPKAVLRAMILASARKPLGYQLLAARTQGRSVACKRMSAIGG